MAKSGFLNTLASAAMRGAGALLRSTKAGAKAGGRRTSAGGRRTSAGGRSGSGADGRLDAIAYAPHKDGDADPGEIVWAWIPYEDDAAQGKDRPALAIGYDGALLVVVPLTSKDQHGRPDTLGIGTGPWDRSGRPSWAKLDRLIAVDPDTVRREGAALDRRRFDEVVSRLKAIHGPQLRLTA